MVSIIVITEDEEFQKPVTHEPMIGEDDLPPQVQAA